MVLIAEGLMTMEAGGALFGVGESGLAMEDSCVFEKRKKNKKLDQIVRQEGMIHVKQ